MSEPDRTVTRTTLTESTAMFDVHTEATAPELVEAVKALGGNDELARLLEHALGAAAPEPARGVAAAAPEAAPDAGARKGA